MVIANSMVHCLPCSSYRLETSSCGGSGCTGTSTGGHLLHFYLLLCVLQKD